MKKRFLGKVVVVDVVDGLGNESREEDRRTERKGARFTFLAE